ncbi:amino acid ABC transporter permease [Bordetella hinzii]|uniref:amino acid ABC transporter permease n=1 Tax=Bordetella hinzii TaxID=103855 RepID=UPI001C028196|nr:amino acid ABC transporter permease [Bordetella hinzii]QWF49495.1 amino acid ABC transporter permease [Bordetella hinzii]
MDLDITFLLHGQYGALLLDGLKTTLAVFALAWLLGMALALLIVLLRALPLRPLDALMSLFVEYHRNVPTVVQIMVWYFGMPQVLPPEIKAYVNAGNTEMFFAVIALALNASAYMSEDLRSGLKAIPPAQAEAGRAIGLSFLQSMRYVILPQALRIAVPPLVNRSLILFKDTSLTMVIGVTELTYQAKNIDNLTFRTFDVFAVTTAIYLLCSLCIMLVGNRVERAFPSAYKG